MIGANGFECTSCDIYHVLERYTPNCVACNQKIKLRDPKKPIHSFMVMDDTHETGDMLIKRLYVCSRCHKCNTANFHPDHIYTATELRDCKKHKDGVMPRMRAIRNGEQLDCEEIVLNMGSKRRITLAGLKKKLKY